MDRNRASPGNTPARLPMRSIDWMACGLILVYVWRIQDLFPILATVQLPVLLSLAAIGAWLLGGFATAAQARYGHPVVKAAIFILAWMVLSLPSSIYQGLSFSFIFKNYIKTILMMLVVIASIRGVEDVEHLALTNVVGASIYCLKILTTFSIGADGRLGNLYYYDANGLAMLIAATLPFTIYFVAHGARPVHRVTALAAAGVLLFAIVKTGSRGGFLALIGVGLFLLFYFRAIRVKVRVGAVVGGFLALMVVAGPKYWNMMDTILHPENDYNWVGNSDEGRMAIWKRGIGYMETRPIFGVGAAAFTVAEGTLSPLAVRKEMGMGFKWSAAHNSFVQIGAELGVPGLLGFIMMLWGIAKSNRIVAHEAARRGVGTDEASMAQAMMASLVGYVIAGFFLSQAYSAFLYTLCALTVGLATTVRRPKKTMTPRLWRSRIYQRRIRPRQDWVAPAGSKADTRSTA